VFFGGLSGALARIACVPIRQFHLLAGDLLHRLRQFPNLIAVLFIGRGDAQRQQVSQRIHRCMDLAAFAFLGPVVAAAVAALRRGLLRPAVHDHRAGRGVPAGQHAQQRAQIFRHRFKTSGLEPAPRLLIDRGPGRQIVRQHPPFTPGARQPAQAVEEFAQGVLALRRVCLHQRQVRHAEVPFLIGHIAQIGLSFIAHPQRNAQLDLQSTDISSQKLSTGSKPGPCSRS